MKFLEDPSVRFRKHHFHMYLLGLKLTSDKVVNSVRVSQAFFDLVGTAKVPFLRNVKLSDRTDALEREHTIGTI